MNGRLIGLVSAVLAAWCAPHAPAHQIPFQASLNAVQVVPKTPSRAGGHASLVWDHHRYRYDFDLIVYGIYLDDLVGTGPNDTPVQVCWAPRGQNGPIVLDVGWAGEFSDTPSGFRLMVDFAFFGGDQGAVTVDPILLADLLFDGELYVVVHTVDYPDGEIRGQLMPRPIPRGRGGSNRVEPLGVLLSSAPANDVWAAEAPLPGTSDHFPIRFPDPLDGPAGVLPASVYFSPSRGAHAR